MLVELTNTVGKLKERLEEPHCLKAKHLRLMFNNILLSDLDTLLVSGVQRGSVLIEVQGALELFATYSSGLAQSGSYDGGATAMDLDDHVHGSGAPHPVCCSPSPPLG